MLNGLGAQSSGLGCVAVDKSHLFIGLNSLCQRPVLSLPGLGDFLELLDFHSLGNPQNHFSVYR